jgi:hypothetical protein
MFAGTIGFRCVQRRAKRHAGRLALDPRPLLNGG